MGTTRRSRTWRVAVAVAVLAVCLLLVWALFLRPFSDKAFRPAVDPFMNAFNEEDYERAYRESGLESQLNSPVDPPDKEEILEELRMAREVLGPCNALEFVNCNTARFPLGGRGPLAWLRIVLPVNRVSLRRTGWANYKGTFAKTSDVTVLFWCMQRGTSWSISSVVFESPLLDRYVKCPACGEVDRYMKRTCKHCGVSKGADDGDGEAAQL
jgi:hypothetical protein